MEEPPPPPLPMLRAPPALPDELVEEVLIRSPPDDPASLVRAALVCKLWSRLVSAHAFRRRFRDFHLRRRAATMLGFFRNVFQFQVYGSWSARFTRFSRLVRTSTSCPPLNTQRGWLALDARGGRVLLGCVDTAATGIRMASTRLLLGFAWPSEIVGFALCRRRWPPGAAHPRRAVAPALLCCDQNGLRDHADGPFRVVLVGKNPMGRPSACVYSFRPAAWSELAYAAQHPDPGDVHGGLIARDCGALVGNALYFLFLDWIRILKYDLATGDISVIRRPPAPYSRRVLTTTEDGSLGLAGVVGDRLHLWSMVLSFNGGALTVGFTQGRRIDLSRLLPSIILLGFADDVGMIVLKTNDGIFSVGHLHIYHYNGESLS